jgi:protein O-mannosyl-transferase
MKKKRAKKQNETPAIPSSQLSQALKPIPHASFQSRNLLGILAALIALNVFIYIQMQSHDFTRWDDPNYVSQNFEVSHGLTWEGVRWAFTTGQEANWHPLTWLSHMLDVQLFGMAPGAHHLINLLFHIANTLLLFWILFRMTTAIGRSAFVAGLFAAHPLHVESVAWLAERKDVLCAFFLLLAIWAYIAYVRKPIARRYLSVAALFTLALMAKPMAVTLPVLLFLLDIWPLGRLNPGPGQMPVFLRLVREKVPLIVLAMASSAVTIGVQWRGGAVAALDSVPLSDRIANALASYVAYLGNMLWPANLSAFYPYGPLPELRVVVCFLAIAGVSVIAVRSVARHPYILVGWMWYLAALAPVIGLIQVGSQAKADRYTYLPSIGIFIVIAWVIPKALGRMPKTPLAIAGSILICVLAAAAHSQAAYWINGTVLWEHALKLYPDSHFVHLSLGNEFYNRGEEAKALLHFSEAIRLCPTSAEAQNSLGRTLAGQGHIHEAFEHFSLALRFKPDYEDAHCNLGASLIDLGKIDEAMPHLATALRINARNSTAHYELGIAFFRQGKSDEAMDHFSEALRLKPGYAEAYNWRGTVLSEQGKQDEAIVQYNEAIRIKPDLADARNNLGIALARQGKFDEAVTQYKEALHAKPDMSEAHNGLANALSRQGKLDEAIVHYKEALRISPNNAGTYLNWGIALANQGELDEAIVHYKEALRISPNYAEARCNWGIVLAIQGKPDEAIAQYKESIRAKPYYVEARYNMGTALMMLSRFDEAIAQFSEVLRMWPDNIGAHANIGVALMNKGRKEEAIPHLKEVLRSKPDDKTVNELLRKASGK